MSDARSLLLAHAETLELPSGLKATVTKPRAAECIVAGGIPLPVMAELERKGKSKETNLTLEEMSAALAYNRALVRLAIVALDGEAVKLDDDDLDVIDTDDFDAVLAYATRQRDAEGKE